MDSEARKRIAWTPEIDEYIRRRRIDERANWVQLSNELGIGRTAIRERARTLGCAHLPEPEPEPETDRPEREDMTGSQVLPAGHKDTWNFLLQLTPSVAGAAYPREDPTLALVNRAPVGRAWAPPSKGLKVENYLLKQLMGEFYQQIYDPLDHLT